MFGKENEPAQLIFPTTYKDRIGAFLSWPSGAKALSEALAGSTQASRLALEFRDHWPRFRQSKWPPRFPVLELRCLRYRDRVSTDERGKPHWSLCVRPVPRGMKPKIVEALQAQGMNRVAKWLDRNAGLFGREGKVSLVVLWDSTCGCLIYEVRGAAVPAVTTDVALRQHKGEEAP